MVYLDIVMAGATTTQFLEAETGATVCHSYHNHCSSLQRLPTCESMEVGGTNYQNEGHGYSDHKSYSPVFWFYSLSRLPSSWDCHSYHDQCSPLPRLLTWESMVVGLIHLNNDAHGYSDSRSHNPVSRFHNTSRPFHQAETATDCHSYHNHCSSLPR